MENLERTYESVLRVALASFGGLFAGYGAGARKEGFTSISSNNGSLRRSPPTVNPTPLQRSVRFRTARKWGLSCFLFATIMESSRLFSPTKLLWDLVQDSESEKNSEPELRKKSLTACGDYALGGTLAGIAGSRAFNIGTHFRGLSSYLRGGYYGLFLGLAGGVIQAALYTLQSYEETMNENEEDEESADALKR